MDGNDFFSVLFRHLILQLADSEQFQPRLTMGPPFPVKPETPESFLIFPDKTGEDSHRIKINILRNSQCIILLFRLPRSFQMLSEMFQPSGQLLRTAQKLCNLLRHLYLPAQALQPEPLHIRGFPSLISRPTFPSASRHSICRITNLSPAFLSVFHIPSRPSGSVVLCILFRNSSDS